MAWQLVAEGPPDDFNPVGAIDELPHGTYIKMQADTLPGLAYLADIWGAEWVIERFMVEGVTITDSYSRGSSVVIVEGYVNSPTVATIVAIVLVVIAIGGIGYIIHELRMWAKLPGEGPLGDLGAIVKWGAIGAVGVLGIKLISDVVKGAKT